MWAYFAEQMSIKKEVIKCKRLDKRTNSICIICNLICNMIKLLRDLN